MVKSAERDRDFLSGEKHLNDFFGKQITLEDACGKLLSLPDQTRVSFVYEIQGMPSVKRELPNGISAGKWVLEIFRGKNGVYAKESVAEGKAVFYFSQGHGRAKKRGVISYALSENPLYDGAFAPRFSSGFRQTRFA